MDTLLLTLVFRVCAAVVGVSVHDVVMVRGFRTATQGFRTAWVCRTVVLAAAILRMVDDRSLMMILAQDGRFDEWIGVVVVDRMDAQAQSIFSEADGVYRVVGDLFLMSLPAFPCCFSVCSKGISSCSIRPVSLSEREAFSTRHWEEAVILGLSSASSLWVGEGGAGEA